MKKLILISSVMVLTFVCCNNSRDNENQTQEAPKALQEDKSYDLISKSRDDDMILSIYHELAEKTPELKDLETRLKTLAAAKDDSLKLYNTYDGKNQSYYYSANNHIGQIKDSTLRKKMKFLISLSVAKYKSKVFQHAEILKSIEMKSMKLDDLHEMLIIATTLPVIEKFQNDKLPSTKSIQGYSKQTDKVVQIENSLFEKNYRKEKKE